MKLTLNVDLGELPNEPDELYALATVVNIACGGHAGNTDSMRHAIARALQTGAEIAAHPSYPDRDNFGRVTMTIATDALRAAIADQCAALVQAGARTFVVKPHGALYHDANRSPALALAVIEGAEIGLGGALQAIVAPPAGAFADLAKSRGIALRREGFADRGYRADGSLVPRKDPGALLENESDAAAQALALAARGTFDTLCIHGDTPGAVTIARAVRAALVSRGFLA